MSGREGIYLQRQKESTLTGMSFNLTFILRWQKEAVEGTEERERRNDRSMYSFQRISLFWNKN